MLWIRIQIQIWILLFQLVPDPNLNPQVKSLQILGVHFETAARHLKHFTDFLIIFDCVKTYLTIFKKKLHKNNSDFLVKKGQIQI